jgi:hypothetical protein
MRARAECASCLIFHFPLISQTIQISDTIYISQINHIISLHSMDTYQDPEHQMKPQFHISDVDGIYKTICHWTSVSK